MQVFITPRASKNFDSIVSFIKQTWGENSAMDFVHSVDEIFKLLKEYPLIGKIETIDIRGFQLTKQTRILYKIKGNKIIILSFFDVRQDPKKM